MADYHVINYPEYPSDFADAENRKLSALQLAEEVGIVSKACKIKDCHRDTFYEVRRAFRVGGVAALVEEKRGPKHPHPNRVAPAVGPSGVRCVWSRHSIETRYKRLMRLEQHAQRDTIVLSENQIRLLERHSVEFRCRHVEASRPGELLNQDTFYWGTLKGVGKVYVQAVVDVFCSLALATVYTAKIPVTAADLL